VTIPVVVFDCMVYLQAAARRDGPARACLELAQQGRIELCVSPAIRAEVVDVLSRPKVRRKFPLLTPEAVANFLGDIDGLARSVAEVPTVVTLPRDPKDEPYLNLAVAVGAHRLVSWDNDLLDLMADNPSGIAFRERLPGLVILTPVALLRELTSAPPPDEHKSDERGNG
jgi:putative PIN family toxin of toxin-antitoxin system